MFRYLKKIISTPMAIGTILVLAVSLGVFTYWQCLGVQQEELESGEITIPKKKLEQKELEEVRIHDSISNMEIIARENKSDENKTDIFIKDPKNNKEELYICLPDIDRKYFKAAFRNKKLYIVKGKTYSSRQELWRYSSSNESLLLFRTQDRDPYPQSPIYDFKISSDERFVVIQIMSDKLPSKKLVFIDVVNKKNKELEPYELTTNEIWGKREEGWRSASGQPRIRIELSAWSPNSKYFWGLTYFVTSNDPPLPSETSVFKVSVEDWRIEKFTIPELPKTWEVVLNPEREEVLYVKLIPGLSLRLYNLRSQQSKTIVFYPQEIFTKYFESSYPELEYNYPLLVGGNENKARFLKPKWIDNSNISYIDFETREEVIKHIE